MADWKKPAIMPSSDWLQTRVRCFKEIWKVGKVGRVGKVGKVGNVGEVGKVGREGLFMPTWSQLWLPVHWGILAISWQDFLSTLLQGLTWFSVTQTGCRWLISYMEQKKFLACEPEFSIDFSAPPEFSGGVMKNCLRSRCPTTAPRQPYV